MLRFLSMSLALVVVAVGCGKGDLLLRTNGRVLKGGEAFVPGTDENLRIIFVPITPDGSPPKNHYIADVDQAKGTFTPSGGNHLGMPEGKYRVAVELRKQRKDQFDGRFDEEKSPFVVEVSRKTPEIVIDLEKPPAG